MSRDLPLDVREWLDAGRYLDREGNRIYVYDTNSHPGPAVFILHGFPSSSYDWHLVAPKLAVRARVVTFDFLGYGLSDKPPDARYSLFEGADLAEAVARDCGVERCVLVTHDMGQTVGAELMQRHAEGKLPFTLDHVIVTNGSTFIDMAALSDGQKLLLEMPDEQLPEPLDLEGFRPALLETFSDEHRPPREEIDAMLALLRHNGGDRLLPRLIRYVEERRANLDRWTGALTSHDGPMSVVWGEQDPIAVVDMAHRIKDERPSTDLVIWPDVGHWPSIEVPDRMADAILERMP